MHFGLIMECDYRYGNTLAESFDEAFSVVDAAESGGLDGVWLAERHFAAPRNPLDPMAGGIPSIVSAPLIMASAIAARTEMIRIGCAVAVLPLLHPVRMAEEAATVDQISKGRFDFGVGRSGFARSYQGYNIPYEESRERFQESLDVILNAWTHERFSHKGKFFEYNDVCVLPKPYQQPYPPVRIAATTKETFPRTGAQGYHIFVGLRGLDRPDLAQNLREYQRAWKEAGHEGEGDVFLRIPIYVAETEEKAHSEPEESTWRAYRRLAETFGRSASDSGATPDEERTERYQRLSTITYDDLLRDRLAYGTPGSVAKQLKEITDELQLSGIIAETNVGGLIPLDRVKNSIRLFAEEVVPQLR
jgi:alkanesulfonate monooxygenase SsuD/methylene tetrahydromethanopterin reductase-like flavin-dependent oxidoreductase (luciferase family)